MEEGRPGWTAEGIARMRALHLLLDDDPKIFEDNLALPFLGSEETIRLKTNLDAYQTSELRSLRAVFVMRHRYAEDELGEAFQHGISQYVILGAGLDPFAYQCPDAMQRLHIYEVDHPPTQQWKRQRLEELGIPIPANLTFIPIDFEVQTLAEGMAASDFKHKEPAFFSWLGVTQYLTEEAVLETLKYVSTHAAPGSEIVFQIVLPQSILSADDQAVVTTAIERASQHGEPWLSFFEPQALEARLMAMGFNRVTHFGSAEASARYFQGRTDGLALPNYFELIKAGLPQ